MIGKKIKALRKKQSGLTQKKLAEKVGVTHQQISSWEIGTYIPSLKFIEKLAGALGCSVNDLI